MITLVKILSNGLNSIGQRLIKFRANGPDDVQENIQCSPFGIDSVPLKDMVAVKVNTSERGKDYVIGYLNKDLLAADGENRLFSVDSDGNLSSYIWLKNNGTIEMMGDADNLAKYNGLEQGFNQLRSDLNGLIQAFNTHVHASAAPGPPVPPTPVPNVVPAVPSTASVESAKFTEVKTI
jgi:hypothetical protein